MKKKLLSLLLATAMLAALAGCGGGKTAADAMDEAGESSAAAEQTKEETEAVQETQEEEEPAAGENKEPAQLDTSERVDLVFYTLGDAPADKEGERHRGFPVFHMGGLAAEVQPAADHRRSGSDLHGKLVGIWYTREQRRIPASG